jgi:hypothetical protein
MYHPETYRIPPLGRQIPGISIKICFRYFCDSFLNFITEFFSDLDDSSYNFWSQDGNQTQTLCMCECGEIRLSRSAE